MFISCFFHITWARNRGDERTQLEAEMGLQHQPQQQTSVQISVFIWCLGILILKLKRFHGSILHNMKMKNKFLCVSFDQGHRSSRAWSMEHERRWLGGQLGAGSRRQSVKTVVEVWPLHCGASDVISDTYFMRRRSGCQKKPGEIADQCTQKNSNF